MKITVLGCNGLYPSKQFNTSGYLLSVEKVNIVLDMGSGVFSTLKELVKPEKVNAIFISHLHFDHISDLGVYNYYLESKAKKGEFAGKIKLLVKNDESAIYRAIAGLNYFEIVEYSDKLTLFDLEFSFYKMKHPVLSHAVTVGFKGKKFGYLSDGNVSENLEGVIKECDLTVAHAPFTKAQSGKEKPHSSAYDIALLAKKYKKQTLISHFTPDSDKKELQEEISFAREFCKLVTQGESYLV